MTIVTISASYGAGGSVIGPRLARRLELPFVDRAIPVSVARDLGLSVDDADELAHNVPGRWTRLFAAMSGMSFDFALPVAGDPNADTDAIVARTETYLRHLADESGAVLIGHAAAFVLADRPDALHVRLDGPVAARISAAMQQHGIDRDEAEAAQRDNDKLRAGYVTHFYEGDGADPAHYDLVLNTTRLGWEQAEEIIVRAAALGDRAPVGLATS